MQVAVIHSTSPLHNMEAQLAVSSELLARQFSCRMMSSAVVVFKSYMKNGIKSEIKR